MMKKQGMPLLTACVMMVFLLLASACSSSTKSNTEGSSPSQAPAASASTASASFPRTITSANGEQVTIAKKLEKVALVHWGLTEDLLSFDIPSIGIALPFAEKQSLLGIDLYKPYMDKHKEVTIVGENTDVNVERLLQYGPDLIIAGTETNQKVADQLSKIAPTIFIDETKMDVWNDWPGVMTKFGEILGQEDVAKQNIAKFQSKFTEAKDQLKGVQGNVVYLQVRDKVMWMQGTQYAGHYYEPLGLQAPEQAKGEGAAITLEGLVQINPDYIFLGYFNYRDKSLPALADEWEKSDVWKTLKAVKDNHVYKMDGEVAYGFGPISRSFGTDAIVKAMK